mgnify:CR=1 FL=1
MQFSNALIWCIHATIFLFGMEWLHSQVQLHYWCDEQVATIPSSMVNKESGWKVNVVDGLAGRIHKLMFKGILESIQRLVLNFKPQICMCIHLLQSTWAKALFGLFLCYDCTLMLIVYPWVLVLGPPLLVTAINETHW